MANKSPVVVFDGQYRWTADGEENKHVENGEDQRQILKDLKQSVGGTWDTNEFERRTLWTLFFNPDAVRGTFEKSGSVCPDWFISKYNV